MMQCDFGYMISPDMFGEFVQPELEATCTKLPRSFYHLDGNGQLSHLDLLLSIEPLAGIQWVPSKDGDLESERWPDVARSVYAAGKKVQIFRGGFETIDGIVERVGIGAGLHHGTFSFPIDRKDEVLRRLNKYDVAH